MNVNTIKRFTDLKAGLKILGWVTLAYQFDSGPGHHLSRKIKDLQSVLALNLKRSKLLQNEANLAKFQSRVAKKWPAFSGSIPMPVSKFSAGFRLKNRPGKIKPLLLARASI